MGLLILGLVLWVAGHKWRWFLPDFYTSIGPKARGVSALAIVASVVLMVIGFRAAPVIHVWSPPSFLTHVNNLLILFAFYIFFITATKPGSAFVMGRIKNPQLTGFKTWAIAHLLVNGDLASIFLFGGLLAWAVFEVIAAKSAPPRDARTPPISNPFVHLALVLVVFGVASAVHFWTGHSPFGG